MNTETNIDALAQSLDALRDTAPITTADELSSLVLRIKEHEAIAFHQLREIGSKLNRAAQLKSMDTAAMSKWARNELSYTPMRTYRLRRFADRMLHHPEERLVGMFERTGRNALWLMLDAQEAAICEIDELASKQRARATQAQVERIKAKYNAAKKAALTELDTVNLLIENSLDQDVEVRKLEATIKDLTEQLSTKQNKVRILEEEQHKLDHDLDAVHKDLDESHQRIATLKLKLAQRTDLRNV